MLGRGLAGGQPDDADHRERAGDGQGADRAHGCRNLASTTVRHGSLLNLDHAVRTFRTSAPVRIRLLRRGRKLTEPMVILRLLILGDDAES